MNFYLSKLYVYIDIILKIQYNALTEHHKTKVFGVSEDIIISNLPPGRQIERIRYTSLGLRRCVYECFLFL